MIDTSSIKFIKRYLLSASHKKYLGHISDRIGSDEVACPPHVISELKRFPTNDILKDWAREQGGKASRYGKCQEQMPFAMSNQAVARCIDHRVTSGDIDPADPWVIATALYLRDVCGRDGWCR